jgi:hypothetical protein
MCVNNFRYQEKLQGFLLSVFFFYSFFMISTQVPRFASESEKQSERVEWNVRTENELFQKFLDKGESGRLG